MRTCILASSALCVPLLLSAQPVLTEAGSIPPVGHMENHNVHITIPPPALATSGIGVTWNIGSAIWNGAYQLTTYHDPADSPYDTDQPGTTLAAEVEGNSTPTTWRHYAIAADIALYLGPDSLPYDSAETLCTFPLSYGDGFVYTYQENGGTPVENAVQYVASGEVVTPWGTVSDVVLFSLDSGTVYRFYQAGDLLDPIGTYIPGAFLQFDEVTDLSGIEDLRSLPLSIRPNPAWDVAHISLPQNGSAALRIVDATGRCVRYERVQGPAIDIVLAGLPPGLYTVEVAPAGGRVRYGKLVVR